MKKSITLISLVCVLAAVVGCGGKLSKAKQPALVNTDWRNTVGSKMDLRVVKAKTDRPELPDGGVEHFDPKNYPSGPDQNLYVIQNNEVVIKPVIDFYLNNTQG